MTSKPTVISGPDIYCITDPDLSKLPLLEQVSAMISGGAPIIQLRAKELSRAELRSVATAARDLCRLKGRLFLLNDHVELAAEIGVDGVHIGQDDMAPEEARRLLGPQAVVGLSTHNEEQFRAALDAPVDYIAVGPVFGTTTKRNPDPATGLELVALAAELMRADARPLVLIGGITRSNVGQLLPLAPRAIMVSIGDLLRRDDLAQAVRTFRQVVCSPFP